MHQKIHLKKKIRINIKGIHNKVILIFVLFIISMIFIFRYINNKVVPLISDYASIEAKNISIYIINKSIADNVINKLDLNELFSISKNSNNEINTVDFNPIIVNKMLSEITNFIHLKLQNLEEGNIENFELPKSNYYPDLQRRNKGVLFEIPSGIVFNNAILSNIGPRIPVKISFVGDIISNLNTKVTNYGINNALIEISLNVKVTEKVILPISIKNIEVELNIPIAIKIIQGNIPNYYLNGLTGNSPILTVPIQ